MAIEVVMPQMGESVAEGTVVRWNKKIGDRVERDEPLFEISTDKVDAEIPSPAAGIIAEIRVMEGQTVPVNTIVAVIGQTVAHKEGATPTAGAPPPMTEAGATSASGRSEEGTAGPVIEQRTRRRSSPLARRIAREHNVDILHLYGTGISGRITKRDILGYIERDGGPRSSGQEPRGERTNSRAPDAGPQADAAAIGNTVQRSALRKKIAEHMILSRRTAAHVHSVFEVDCSRITKIRPAEKAADNTEEPLLAYLPVVVKAVVDGLRRMPVINASIDGDDIVYHREVNIGIAMALESGVRVPVIQHADEKSLRGLRRAVVDLATRARTTELGPGDEGGGTFTVADSGAFNALLAMPIINQPQIAILGIGAVEKRPVVVDDAIAIRPMAYMTLGYDHRLVDGAVADEFMSHVKRILENWDDAIES